MQLKGSVQRKRKLRETRPSAIGRSGWTKPAGARAAGEPGCREPRPRASPASPALRRRRRARVVQAPRACRALHALIDRGSRKAPNSAPHPPGDPHHALRKARRTLLRAPAQAAVELRGRQTRSPQQPYSPCWRRSARRKRPAQPCACVEGRPAPTLNGALTCTAIG